MLVVGQQFSQMFGKNSIAYVNLGNAQGVKMGDYLRIFRYQGSNIDTLVNIKDTQYKLYGFGMTLPQNTNGTICRAKSLAKAS